MLSTIPSRQAIQRQRLRARLTLTLLLIVGVMLYAGMALYGLFAAATNRGTSPLPAAMNWLFTTPGLLTVLAVAAACTWLIWRQIRVIETLNSAIFHHCPNCGDTRNHGADCGTCPGPR